LPQEDCVIESGPFSVSLHVFVHHDDVLRIEHEIGCKAHLFGIRRI
jgi:hypothetical protein